MTYDRATRVICMPRDDVRKDVVHKEDNDRTSKRSFTLSHNRPSTTKQEEETRKNVMRTIITIKHVGTSVNGQEDDSLLKDTREGGCMKKKKRSMT
jgi:hypothetical protein